MSSSVKSVNDVTTTWIFLLSTISPIVTFALLKILTSEHNPFRIPLFDASSSLCLPGDHSGLRWDTIHFSLIATKGYEYEQQLAFQPGWQGVLWFSGWLWRAATGKGERLDAVVRGSTVLMVIIAGWRGTALYK
jgi:phosphatidylinositol glycan class V